MRLVVVDVKHGFHAVQVRSLGRDRNIIACQKPSENCAQSVSLIFPFTLRGAENFVSILPQTFQKIQFLRYGRVIQDQIRVLAIGIIRETGRKDARAPCIEGQCRFKPDFAHASLRSRVNVFRTASYIKVNADAGGQFFANLRGNVHPH